MALTDAQIAAMGFGLPVGTDLIKNGDNEISKNARAAAEGIVEARWKKGLIPNGVDIREYMYGTEGQYTALSAVETRTMTGLPQDLVDSPLGFTCVAETLQGGTALTLTVYDVWGNRKYSCTSAPSSGSNDGWTYWSKYKWDNGDDGETQDTGSSASGFKTLPFILTAGRGGGEALAPLSANVEYDVNLAPSIYTPRFRFAIRDGNPRWGTSTAQVIQLSNISVGGVAKLSSMATNSDGSITFSPWMDGKLGNLKFDYVAQQQPRYIIGGGRVNGARRTEMPFELWLEIEVPASTPAIGLVGDSNSVGVNTTIPINDAWMSIYCRRMGFFPVLYGHSGDGMSQAQTVDHYKWNRWNHLDRPDMVVHANGANDIPATEGGVTLAQMQEWARNEWAISDAKISKIKHAAVIKSRASGINNTVRVAYNNWLKSMPDPIRDWQDIASPVTANDTGGLLPQYISSDGQHMNTAGQTAIGNSPLKVMTYMIAQGAKGDPGPPGAGVPAGGEALQVIRMNAFNTTTEWATLTKSLVGLSNVDNTSDMNKPVSTMQKLALDEKLDLAQLPDGVDGVNKNLIENSASLTATALSAAIDDKTAGVPRLTAPDHLTRTRTRLARAMFQQTAIYIEGDSITSGANSNDAAISAPNDWGTASTRGFARQLGNLFSAHLGIDAGIGWIGLGADEGWTITGAVSMGLAAGPVAQGGRLPPAASVELKGRPFTYVDLTGWWGGNSAMPAQLFADGADIRPSLISGVAKTGAAWEPRGGGSTNTIVANPGTRRVTLTNIADGGVVADSGLTQADAVAVTPGQVFMVTGCVTGTRNALTSVGIRFWDSSGASLSELATSAMASGTGGTFAGRTEFVTVPANAATARLVLRATGALAGDVYEFRDFDAIPVTLTAVPSGAGSFYRYQAQTTPGNHDLKLSGVAAGNCDISGLILRNRLDAGIVVHKMGKSGSTTTDHVGVNLATDYLRDQQRMATFDMPNKVLPVALRIIALGTNDSATGNTAAYVANLQTLIGYAHAQGEDVLIAAGPRYADRPALDVFYLAAKDLASSTPNVAFIDIADSWGTNAQSNAAGFLDFANFGIHPTLAGHGDYARILADALTRQLITRPVA